MEKLKPTITVYSYHPKTLEYIGESTARLCPVEGHKTGEYHLPAHSTSEQPPEFKDGFRIVFDKNNNLWRYVAIPVKTAQEVKEDTQALCRSKRNSLLAKSDVYMLMDNYAALSDDNKKAWIVYRQYLRDLPTKPEFETPEQWTKAPNN